MAHNFTEAVSYTKVKNSTNQRILNQSLIHSTYRVWVPAWEWAQVGMVGQWITSDGTIPQHWLIPDGTTETFSYYLARPQEWRNGTLGLVLHWISGAQDTAQAIEAALYPVYEDGPMAVSAPAGHSPVSNPGADCLTISPIYGSAVSELARIRKGVGGIHALISWKAVNGDTKFLGAEITYLERGTSAGTNN